MIILDTIEYKEKKIISAGEDAQLCTWGMYNQVELEAPIYIGRSQIETEFIGAYTYINLRAVQHLTTNSVVECQRIGRFCMIAHSVNIGMAGHPTKNLSSHLVFRYDKKTDYAHDYMTIENTVFENEARIKYIENAKKPLPIIGNDVWIGHGATILNGIRIGDGAIVGAGSVVTKDVPAYSIVAGNPAKVIRYRFSEKQIEKLENLRWWKYGADILYGIDLEKIDDAINIIEDRIENKVVQLFTPPRAVIDSTNNKIEIKEF